MPGFNLYSIFACMFWIGIILFVYRPWREYLDKLFTFPASTSSTHLSNLDAIRGLTALFVACFHSWQWRIQITTLEVANIHCKSSKAVPILVALSGLVIYRALQQVTCFDDLRVYFNRRFLRIFPLYFVTTLVACLILGPYQVDLSSIQYLLSELFMLRAFQSPIFANPQTWSLYPEMVFYIICPVFVILTIRKPLFWSVIALIIFSFCDLLGPRELGLWKYIMFGIIAAQLIKKYKLSSIFATGLTSLGLIIVYYDVQYNEDWVAIALTNLFQQTLLFKQTYYNASYNISLGIGICCVFIGIVQSNFYRIILNIFPLKMLSTISYSLFMWHSFLIIACFPIRFDGLGGILNTYAEMPTVPEWYLPLVMIPAYIASAACSYILIERPFLSRRKKVSKSIERVPETIVLT